MATLSGTIRDVALQQDPLGVKKDSSGRSVHTALVTFTITGTYAQADDAQLLLVPTAMQALIKNGATIAYVRSACMAAPGDEAGTPIGVGACTISGTTISFALTGGDLVTEHAGAALGTINAPIGLWVTWVETAPA